MFYQKDIYVLVKRYISFKKGIPLNQTVYAFVLKKVKRSCSVLFCFSYWRHPKMFFEIYYLIIDHGYAFVF
jgi:hypothetical protein